MFRKKVRKSMWIDIGAWVLVLSIIFGFFTKN
jgi:uncharacterized membrane protein